MDIKVPKGNLLHTEADEIAVHSFCKQALKSRLFIGSYKERRYIDSLSDYRDLIVIDHDEKNTQMILEEIRQRLLCFYQNTKWIGIMSCYLSNENVLPAPITVSIWTKLDELAFGQYWFRIKSVKFKPNEIILRVDSIRAVRNASTSVVPKKSDQHEGGKAEISLEDFYKLLIDWRQGSLKAIYLFLVNIVTIGNITDSLKFITLLLLSIFSTTIHSIKYLGNFIIQCTPIILAVVDLFNKIVGGFYILVAMVWRDLFSVVRVNRAPNQKAIMYNQRPPSSFRKF